MFRKENEKVATPEASGHVPTASQRNERENWLRPRAVVFHPTDIDSKPRCNFALVKQFLVGLVLQKPHAAWQDAGHRRLLRHCGGKVSHVGLDPFPNATAVGRFKGWQRTYMGGDLVGDQGGGVRKVHV